MQDNIKQKKKLMLIVTKSNWGGAQRYVFDLATHVPKSAFDVTVVCGGDGELVKQLKAQSIRVIQLSGLARDINIYNEFKVFFQLGAIFRKEAPDIVHLNSSKIGGLGALAGRFAGIPKIIFTAHGWAFNEDRSVVSKLIIRFLSWITAVLCHRTITISRKEQKQTLSFPFISDAKVRMIYIGIPHQQYLPQNAARHLILERTKNETRPHTLWVGSLGELHGNKGHIYSLEAIKHMHESGMDIFYCIIGEGEKRAEFEAYIKANDMEKYCVLPGTIPTDTSGSTLLKAFDVFIFPSLKEGLPFAVLEALQAEVPIIASKVGGIPEIIESKKNGLLIPPKNVFEIRTALESVLPDKDIKEGYRLKGKKCVQKKFTLEAMLHATLLEYEN